MRDPFASIQGRRVVVKSTERLEDPSRGSRHGGVTGPHRARVHGVPGTQARSAPSDDVRHRIGLDRARWVAHRAAWRLTRRRGSRQRRIALTAARSPKECGRPPGGAATVDRAGHRTPEPRRHRGTDRPPRAAAGRGAAPRFVPRAVSRAAARIEGLRTIRTCGHTNGHKAGKQATITIVPSPTGSRARRRGSGRPRLGPSGGFGRPASSDPGARG